MAESNEFRIAGTDEDAALHEPILGNRPAAAFIRQSAFNRAIARGVPESTALRLYGDSDPQPG